MFHVEPKPQRLLLAWFLLCFFIKINSMNYKGILLTTSLVFLCVACIPIRIAPKIEDYKITKGKKFKRGLPKQNVFIFEDPKDADHFYDYIITKFELNNLQWADVNVPIQIHGEEYYLSYYEIEIQDKTLNMFPGIFNAVMNRALNNEEDEEYMSGEDVIRNGNFYLALEVLDNDGNDCLKEESLSRAVVLNYLRELKKEYLSTHNYNEVVFKN